MLQRAAAALRERPVLFKYCAEEVAQARHNALFQRCASDISVYLIGAFGTGMVSWLHVR